MIKRITSFVLTMLLVLASAAFAGAEDTVETTVDIQVYTLNVTVKTSISSGSLTLKVYPLEIDAATGANVISDISKPIHVDQADSSATEGTAYVYKFAPFNFKTTQKSGKYRAVVNKIYEYDFDFVNKGDKINFYNSLAKASSDGMEDVLQQGVKDELVDFDMGCYFEYSEGVKTHFNNALVALSLPTLSEDASDEEVTDFENLLKPEFARLLKVADFVTATESDFDSVVRSDAKELGLDLTFYSDEKLALDPQGVREKLASISVRSFAAEDVQDAFSLAVLLDIINEADYGAITDALEYYDGKVITLDKSDSKNFTDAELNRVSRLMKQDASVIKSATSIESKYAKYAEEVADGSDSDSGSSSSSGSSGSSGGSGSRRPAATGSTSASSSSTVTNNSGSTSGNVAVNTDFSDLHEASWAENSIRYLASKHVLNGKGNGKFCPNDTVTREEFVKIIVEAFNIYNETAEFESEDVSPDRWSYRYIASAHRAGVINGKSETVFDPEGVVSRQDMAVMIYRVASLAGLNLTNTDLDFADAADIADYAKTAVGALYGAGIINGTGDNCYSPLDVVTRAQAAKIVYELLSAMGGVN